MELNSAHMGYYLKMKTVVAIGTVDTCTLQMGFTSNIIWTSYTCNEWHSYALKLSHRLNTTKFSSADGHKRWFNHSNHQMELLT